MSARLLAAVLGLAALGFGCDSGSGGGPAPTTERPDREEPEMPGDYRPEVIEACRGVYRRLPAEEQAAITEEAFVLECLDAVDGVPDPMTAPPA